MRALLLCRFSFLELFCKTLYAVPLLYSATKLVVVFNSYYRISVDLKLVILTLCSYLSLYWSFYTYTLVHNGKIQAKRFNGCIGTRSEEWVWGTTNRDRLSCTLGTTNPDTESGAVVISQCNLWCICIDYLSKGFIYVVNMYIWGELLSL